MVALHPKAVSVEPRDERRVRVVFSDGLTADVDLRPLLVGPVFARIRDDAEAFAQVRVAELGGCLEWPDGPDVDPEVLYELATANPASAAS